MVKHVCKHYFSFTEKKASNKLVENPKIKVDKRVVMDEEICL